MGVEVCVPSSVPSSIPSPVCLSAAMHKIRGSSRGSGARSSLSRAGTTGAIGGHGRNVLSNFLAFPSQLQPSSGVFVYVVKRVYRSHMVDTQRKGCRLRRASGFAPSGFGACPEAGGIEMRCKQPARRRSRFGQPAGTRGTPGSC
jgi:hypothetical protein